MDARTAIGAACAGSFIFGLLSGTLNGLLVGGLSDPCTETATLPDVAVPVTCAPPSVVSVRDSEHGPVVLCLCPTLTDGDDAPAEWEGTSAQTEGM